MSLKNFRYSQFLKNYKKKSQFVTFVKISFSSKKTKTKKHVMLLQIILRIETEIGREKNSGGLRLNVIKLEFFKMFKKFS